ncbi:hypothetical protein [Orenia marismortui]|uniref:Capsular polysaccharide export protein n=1 Tax=Orenia marismortui TaxID=46469 RepID=A0A4R8HGP5_9FIRM|nr:hypothetical protein [Orenia marismortui]TDX59272.1 hypothetical protein C7959_101159 [Orenia marismortui]
MKYNLSYLLYKVNNRFNPFKYIVRKLYYMLHKDYKDEHSKEVYDELLVKFPRAKKLFFPHIMHPTEINKKSNKQGNKYIFLFYKIFIDTLLQNKDLFMNNIDRIDIIWSEKNLRHCKSEKKLIIEHGWLPRSSYQISSLGANFRSHISSQPFGKFTNLIGGKREVIRKINKLIKSNTYSLKNINDIPNQFIVVPLQTGNDLNLLHSGTQFRKYYGKSNSTKKFGQALIDFIEHFNLPYPVIFTQHPADSFQGNYEVNHKNLFITNNSKLKTIDLIRLRNRCKGVISVNSNVIHEAICYNIPCCVMGRLLWHENTSSPFISDIENFIKNLNKKPLDSSYIIEYIAKLLSYQWYISDFQNPHIILEILKNNDNIVPIQIRRKYSYIPY